MWDNGVRNIKLDQARLIDMGPLNGDSAFNVAAQRVRKGFSSLSVWFAETWTKRRLNEVELPELPLYTVEERL